MKHPMRNTQQKKAKTHCFDRLEDDCFLAERFLTENSPCQV